MDGAMSRDISFAGLPAAGKTMSDMSGTAASMPTMDKTQRQHEGFRSHNLRFLQEQNKEVTRALDKVERERDEKNAEVDRWDRKKEEIAAHYGKLQQQLADTEEKCHQSALEINQRDEQIRVLSEQNKSLLDLLEKEEVDNKEREANVRELSSEKDRLQQISDQFDNIKDSGNKQLTGAYTEIAKYEEEFRNAQNETAQLKEAEENFRAQAKVELDDLEKKVSAAKAQNVEHLQVIQHNEVHEHRMSEAIQRLKEQLDELTVQKKGIRMQMDLSVDQRDKWTQSKVEVERRKEGLERTVDALRHSLRGAEEQNTRMQDENKAGADNFRQLGDKVYALMDQLRQHQSELKKHEASSGDKTKRIGILDKQSTQYTQTLQLEVDAKLSAEAEARSAAQMQALLQKKNRMLEEAHQLALKAQEKVERRLQELTDKAGALQAQNDYLATRIDGNEEDKGTLRYELRRGEDELRQATTSNAQLTQQHAEVDDRANEVEAEKAAFKAELDYIKREDMVDESGRTKPILIESDSKLIERLQINEFLYSAQQARNPVPMLVEKVSHILEMMHTAQSQSDLYLQDLQRSNTMLTALRQKNMTLYEKVQLCESWKLRALLKIASNEFEYRKGVKGHRNVKESYNLFLDGLQYTNKELEEVHKLITSYGKEDLVKEIRLQDNSLDKSSVPALCALMDLCTGIAKLNLKRNNLDDDAISELQHFVERIPGVTSTSIDPVSKALKAKSGKVDRLVIELEDQGSPPDPNDPTSPKGDVKSEVAVDSAINATDAFLSSGAGLTGQAKLQGPGAPGYPASGTSKTLLPHQKGMGESKSEMTLPRISASGGRGLH